ncbi:glutathione S-transferase family protein [Paracoccus sp. p3-h83]
MITLYGCYRSRASRNLWLLGELGRDVAHVPVVQRYRISDDQAARMLHTAHPDYLAITATGAIPALVDGDLVLTESLAINLHLAEGSPLGPRDGAERAQMIAAALYAATALEDHTLAIQMAYGAGQGDGAAVTEAVDRLRRPLAVIEAQLARHGHPVGGRFTVADINLAEVLRYAQPHAALWADYPATRDWLAACQSRPAFRAMWAAREAELLA